MNSEIKDVKVKGIPTWLVHASAVLFLVVSMWSFFEALKILSELALVSQETMENVLQNGGGLENMRESIEIFIELIKLVVIVTVLSLPFIGVFIVAVYRSWASLSRWKEELSPEQQGMLMSPFLGALALVIPFLHVFLHFSAVFGLIKAGESVAKVRGVPYQGPSRGLVLQFCWFGVATLVLSCIMIVMDMLVGSSSVVLDVLNVMSNLLFAVVSVYIYIIALKLNDFIKGLNDE